MRAFDLARQWPAPNVAVVVIDNNDNLHTHGDTSMVFHLTSISKVMTAWATLIAVEDGSVSLEDPVGQDGCTLRHLLSHAGGYGFSKSDALISPERKRVYSNPGYDMIARHVAEATQFEFADYLHEAVFAPLAMTSALLDGNAAKDVYCNINDMARFLAEMKRPTLIGRDTFLEATSSQYPDLAGVVPGFGYFNPCSWGLGPELRASKSPHWTATRNSSSTYGHFGGSGTFAWVDPVANVACCALTDLAFEAWAREAWPVFGDAVLEELGR